jgi:hypothetical protein
MRIAWMQGKQEWAFKHLCEHLRRAMPKHEHAINEPRGADAVFYVCPSQLDYLPDRKNAIQHIDSNRWYERNCLENKL